MTDEPGFTCPRCGMVSFNKTDIEQGYCGKCHDWTGAKTGELIVPGQINERVAYYAAAALSASTIKGYRDDFAWFTRWCTERGVTQIMPCTHETLAQFCAEYAQTHSVATLRRIVHAVTKAHRIAGQEFAGSRHPLVRDTLRGIAKLHGKPLRQSAALTSVEVRRMVATCGNDLRGARDRALILTGFAGALRRSEIIGIDREHLGFPRGGMTILLPSSKADAEGRGVTVRIIRANKRQTCPVEAMERWIERSRCEFGPVFHGIDRWGGLWPGRMSDESVRRVVLRLAHAAKIKVPEHEIISAHGLRAGFITEAYRNGGKDADIMEHSRHRTLTAMLGYVRRSGRRADAAAKLIDL